MAYVMFVKHHILPSDFVKLSPKEKAAAIAFLQTQISDEKEQRKNMKGG